MSRQSSRIQRNLTSNGSPPPRTRPRRAASGSHATITREESDSPDDSRHSLRLTVKMPSSRLREAISARDTPDPDTAATSRSTRTKARKSYVMESESDENEDAEPENEIPDSDDMDVDQPSASMQEDEDAEGEEDEDDEDEDVDMDDDADDGLPLGTSAPAGPTTSLKINGPAAPRQPKVTVTPAKEAKSQSGSALKSVEEKEMELDDDDEELSELGSDDDEDDEGDNEDADGEEDDELDDDGNESRSPDVGSRASTPDVSKLTKRQRSRLDQVVGNDFLQLPMEPQIKKHFTPEEHAMRRAEMARRRKNLSEKRNEEEKADTINRLLKKQAPKRRGKISQAEIEAQDRGDDEEEGGEGGDTDYVQPANPVFVRWISDKGGCRVGVPSEWLGTKVGRAFGSGNETSKMVEEIEG